MITITGSEGFIGTHVRMLLEGKQVRRVDIWEPPGPLPGITECRD